MGGDIKMYAEKVAFSWRFSSLAEMAAEVERVFGGQQLQFVFHSEVEPESSLQDCQFVPP